MTVAQLISALQQCDPSGIVITNMGRSGYAFPHMNPMTMLTEANYVLNGAAYQIPYINQNGNNAIWLSEEPWTHYINGQPIWPQSIVYVGDSLNLNSSMFNSVFPSGNQ